MFTSSFVFGIAAVHTAAGYIMSRFLIGWALAGFVTCQFWTSIMFSPNVVGFANALAGGWGNAGQTQCLLLCEIHGLCFLRVMCRTQVHCQCTVDELCVADISFSIEGRSCCAQGYMA